MPDNTMIDQDLDVLHYDLEYISQNLSRMPITEARGYLLSLATQIREMRRIYARQDEYISQVGG
jgi:hypothetical protein